MIKSIYAMSQFTSHFPAPCRECCVIWRACLSIASSVYPNKEAVKPQRVIIYLKPPWWKVKKQEAHYRYDPKVSTAHGRPVLALRYIHYLWEGTMYKSAEGVQLPPVEENIWMALKIKCQMHVYSKPMEESSIQSKPYAVRLRIFQFDFLLCSQPLLLLPLSQLRSLRTIGHRELRVRLHPHRLLREKLHPS